jgi:hypothetical protein
LEKSGRPKEAIRVPRRDHRPPLGIPTARVACWSFGSTVPHDAGTRAVDYLGNLTPSAAPDARAAELRRGKPIRPSSPAICGASRQGPCWRAPADRAQLEVIARSVLRLPTCRAAGILQEHLLVTHRAPTRGA